MTRKIAFFEGWSWFKFNNLGLALDTNFKFCSGVEKKLELEVRKFWGPNPTFAEVTRENLVEGPFCSPSIPSPPILNRVKKCFKESRTPWFWTIFMDYDFCGYLCIYLFTEAYSSIVKCSDEEFAKIANGYGCWLFSQKLCLGCFV